MGWIANGAMLPVTIHWIVHGKDSLEEFAGDCFSVHMFEASKRFLVPWYVIMFIYLWYISDEETSDRVSLFVNMNQKCVGGVFMFCLISGWGFAWKLVPAFKLI